MLPRPFRGRVYQTSNSHSARQPALNRGLDEIGSEECKWDRHADFSDAAPLAPSDAFSRDAFVIDNLLEPAGPACDRGDRGGASLGTYRTRILGLDGIRQEYLPPPFRGRL